MAEDLQRSTSESIRLWFEAIGIPLVLAGLGIYQFWLKEVVWPAQAPVNLTMELNVKEADSKAAAVGETNDEDLEALELSLTARNPGGRTIYLLRNYWLAYALNVKSVPTSQAASTGQRLIAETPLPSPLKIETWLEHHTKRLNEYGGMFGGKHYEYTNMTPVALSMAFPHGTYLHPSEEVTRRFTFYVPRDLYDAVEVVVTLPTTTKSVTTPDEGTRAVAEAQYVWDVTSGLTPGYARVNTDGSSQALRTNARGNYLQSELDELGLQAAISSVMMSLWRAEPSPTGAEQSDEAQSPTR